CLEDGHPVLLESFLDGPEVSLFCLVDDDEVVPLLPAQDHKRVGDDDRGPNTGGMGAYTPLPWLPEGMVERIVAEVCEPVAREMVARGCGFSGLLHAGLAITSSGPEVVELDCRFGDPEKQAVLALHESPPGVTVHVGAAGERRRQQPRGPGDGAPRSGDVIDGAEQPGVLHAGTATGPDGRLVSAGGRVLSVVGTGPDLAAARAEAYRTLDGIELGGGHFCSDIGRAAEEGRISV